MAGLTAGKQRVRAPRCCPCLFKPSVCSCPLETQRSRRLSLTRQVRYSLVEDLLYRVSSSKMRVECTVQMRLAVFPVVCQCCFSSLGNDQQKHLVEQSAVCPAVSEQDQLAPFLLGTIMTFLCCSWAGSPQPGQNMCIWTPDQTMLSEVAAGSMAS